MSSVREQVIQAVVAMVTAALPFADVVRNQAKADQVGPGGRVIVRDGEPGDPEVDLSPPAYNYDHHILLEVAAYKSVDQSREVVLDGLLLAIGQAVEADRTLGGLCDYLDLEAPTTDDLQTLGSQSGRWADAAIVASYSTPTPLT